jgi:hypothetical protein
MALSLAMRFTVLQVCYACVRAGEFRLAGICGLQILKHPDHLEELILHYERAGTHNPVCVILYVQWKHVYTYGDVAESIKHPDHLEELILHYERAGTCNSMYERSMCMFTWFGCQS